MSKSLSKRIVSYFALAALVFTMFPALAFAEISEGKNPSTSNEELNAQGELTTLASAQALADQINSYNPHGSGASDLNATVAGNTVTVTGGAYNVTVPLALNIDADVTVEWRADFDSYSSGTLLTATGLGTLDIKSGYLSVSSGIVISSTGILNISGGDIYSSAGSATISSTGTVNVSGGAVSSEGEDARTINCTGTINVSSGTVSSTGEGAWTIYCSNPSNVEAVVVSGDGAVTASGTQARAIHVDNSGTVLLKDSGVISTTDAASGVAINCDNENNSLVMQGGTIETVADGAAAISTKGAVEINGGSISTNGDSASAIATSSTQSGVTITNGIITVTGQNSTAVATALTPIAVSGGVVRAGDGPALSTGGAVTVSGTALIFAYGTTIAGMSNVVTAGSLTVEDEGTLIAWNESAGSTSYTSFDTTDIALQTKDGLINLSNASNPAAYWSTNGDSNPATRSNGISYINGTQTDFIKLTGITLTPLALNVADLNYTDPATLTRTADGKATGIGTVTSKDSRFNTTTGGTITVYYQGADTTNYAKSTTPPSAPGTYRVFAEVSGGTDFKTLTGTDALQLGNFTITQATPASDGLAKTGDGLGGIFAVFCGTLIAACVALAISQTTQGKEKHL